MSGGKGQQMNRRRGVALMKAAPASSQSLGTIDGQRQRLLLDELTHRIKNTLAVVQSIVQQTLRGTATPKDVIAKLEGRIMALARAHSLLVDAEWKGANFRELAKQQLEPYGADNSRRIQLEGDSAGLPSDTATPFGLVLHELATNAAKHGSLSTPKGTVHLAWSVTNRNNTPVLTVIWEEVGGPPPQGPKRTGFGTSLIDRGIPRAKVKREMKPKGLVCTIELPLGQQPKGKRDPRA